MVTPDAAQVARDHGFHPVTVRRVVQETDDTRSYVLDIPSELRATFAYRAGQFCTFRLREGDGDDAVEHLRSYSMSTSPDTDDELAVTVKRVPGGKVSGWFHDNVREGTTLEATRPTGVFCLRDSDRPLVGFCGGSGVTPVISLVKSALATTGRTVALYYANRDADSVIFDAELTKLEEQHADRLTVVRHDDSAGGFLDAAGAWAFADRYGTDADFYLCGPTPFMDLVEDALHAHGVAKEHVFVERFGPKASAPAADAADVSDDAADVPSEITIILKRKKHQLPYKKGETILETARRGGVTTPFSCEAGNCATCMAKLLEGTAHMRVNDALTEDEVDEGWILTCQSELSGPAAVVEYEEM
ncbi:MAG TPA: ferredoxin--NADP reductase [Mycobacteriales bacterium]|nr:ferredoxin--NADP reductase [Mycobacteriales bacterium]